MFRLTVQAEAENSNCLVVAENGNIPLIAENSNFHLQICCHLRQQSYKLSKIQKLTTTFIKKLPKTAIFLRFACSNGFSVGILSYSNVLLFCTSNKESKSTLQEDFLTLWSTTYFDDVSKFLCFRFFSPLKVFFN